MKLLSLLNGVDIVDKINFKNVNITNLSIRADQITNNGLFFAIKGNNFDGKDFVKEAISCGAKAVITEEIINDINIPQIVVKDIRLALSIVSRTFFNKPDKKLKIIGVIGTNGKTTTSTIIYNILHDNGEKVGLIGTNGVLIDGLKLPNIMTTPDPIELFYILEQMALFDVRYVVMEISAHAIYYKKTYGICPDIVVYTNITNEHLDFFKTMENYSNVKLNYIKECCDSLKIINVDDEYGKGLLDCDNVISYGLFNPADVFAIDIKMSINSSSFVCNCIDEIIDIKSNLTGDYNVYNILAAIAVVKHLNISSDIVKRSIKNMKKVDGRWEVFNFSNNNKVVIDYAHTPDGFEKVLSTIKTFRKGRIITLFGCVGYSDKVKRKMMGDIAKKYSDFVVITSDNFSDAAFDEIVNDIGIDECFVKMQNRAEAVDFALKMMSKGDTLMLLGKGIENYQKTENGNEEYNEVEFVENYLKNINN